MTLMAIYHSLINPLPPKDFLCNRCRDLYNSLVGDIVSLPKALYTMWVVP